MGVTGFGGRAGAAWCGYSFVSVINGCFAVVRVAGLSARFLPAVSISEKGCLLDLSQNNR